MANEAHYCTVDGRPVMVLERNGRDEAYVFDDANGNFKNDPAYLSLVDVESGRDTVELAASRFEQVLAACRVALVRRWCEQMSAIKGTGPELAAIFGDGTTLPLPLGAEKVEIRPDALAFATVVLRLPIGVLKRWQVEQTFGAGTEEERIRDFLPHRFRYPVNVGALYVCALYVSTPSAAAGIDADVITLALNQEPNRAR
jgi:hypothetical protein